MASCRSTRIKRSLFVWIRIAVLLGAGFLLGSTKVLSTDTQTSEVKGVAQRPFFDSLCYSKDLPIENLNAEKEFRPDWYQKKASNVEDRTYLLPFLLADRVNTAAYTRRIFIDLGAHSIETSVIWFLSYYPVDWDEMYAFEVEKDFDGYWKEENDVWIANQTLKHDWRLQRYLPPLALTGTEKEIGARIRLKLKSIVGFVDLVDLPAKDSAPMHINITRFLRDELNISKSDFVVIKHDIEGMEWSTIPSWLQDGTIDLIDEIFVEIHYGEDEKHSRSEAMALLMAMRDRW